MATSTFLEKIVMNLLINLLLLSIREYSHWVTGTENITLQSFSFCLLTTRDEKTLSQEFHYVTTSQYVGITIFFIVVAQWWE